MPPSALSMRWKIARDAACALARSGALAVIGVNSQHFAAYGFAEMVTKLQVAGLISTPRVDEVSIFDGRDSSHAEDTAFILSFTVN